MPVDPLACCLHGGAITKEEMILLLMTDVNRWNQWREENSFESLELPNLELNAARLNGVNLSNIDLAGTDFRFASLNGAILKLANLSQSQFGYAQLEAAHFGDSYLADAIFTGTNLENADFSGAMLENTVFSDVDLSQSKGLETLSHWGPSTIGIDTIFRSKGKLPESFLRDAGVPEEFIRSVPSLIGAQEDIQFNSCFISFSFTDEEFARRLHGRMRDEKLRVWFAPEDMKGGRKIHEQIEAQIQVQDKLLLLLLSGASMKSEWVATEIHHARQREIREKRQVLFPIALCPFEEIRKWKSFDADSGKDMAREVREYLIPDFSGWKDNDTFEAKFQKLLQDLKSDSPAPPVGSLRPVTEELSQQAMEILKIIEQSGATRAIMFRGGKAFGLQPHGGSFSFSEEPRFIVEDMEALVALGLLKLADYNGAGDPIYAITREGVALVKDKPEIRTPDGNLIGAGRR